LSFSEIVMFSAATLVDEEDPNDIGEAAAAAGT
jgi:hypothetical protein